MSSGSAARQPSIHSSPCQAPQLGSKAKTDVEAELLSLAGSSVVIDRRLTLDEEAYWESWRLLARTGSKVAAVAAVEGPPTGARGHRKHERHEVNEGSRGMDWTVNDTTRVWE